MDVFPTRVLGFLYSLPSAKKKFKSVMFWPLFGLCQLFGIFWTFWDDSFGTESEYPQHRILRNYISLVISICKTFEYVPAYFLFYFPISLVQMSLSTGQYIMFTTSNSSPAEVGVKRSINEPTSVYPSYIIEWTREYE